MSHFLTFSSLLLLSALSLLSNLIMPLPLIWFHHKDTRHHKNIRLPMILEFLNFIRLNIFLFLTLLNSPQLLKVLHQHCILNFFSKWLHSPSCLLTIFPCSSFRWCYLPPYLAQLGMSFKLILLDIYSFLKVILTFSSLRCLLQAPNFMSLNHSLLFAVVIIY